MSKTDGNLKAAFAGESQANRRYLAFAQAADQEGQPQVAKLFRAAAEAETVHALAHLRAMGGVGRTLQNLEAAVAGETHEHAVMYPQFIVEAEQEKADTALTMFRFANRVEEIHAGLFNQLRETLATGLKPAAARIFVCSGCGNTVTGQAPGQCPVCGGPKKLFQEIQ
jgi:rubrerythrin